MIYLLIVFIFDFKYKCLEITWLLASSLTLCLRVAARSPASSQTGPSASACFQAHCRAPWWWQWWSHTAAWTSASLLTIFCLTISWNTLRNWSWIILKARRAVPSSWRPIRVCLLSITCFPMTRRFPRTTSWNPPPASALNIIYPLQPERLAHAFE